jgi:hypothetical protein
MHIRSNATAETIDSMSSEIDAMRGLQETLVLDLAIATLQSEAIGQFVDELIERGASRRGDEDGAIDTTPINVAALAARLRSDIAPMLEVLDGLEARFGRMVGAAEQLEWELRQLGALQVAGRVESAHLDTAQDFRVIFEEIRGRIAVAATELASLRVGRDVLDQIRDGRASTATARSLDRIGRWADGMAAA